MPHETQTQARRRRRRALEAASAATAAATASTPVQDHAGGRPPRRNKSCVTCKGVLDPNDTHLDCVLCLGYAHAYASQIRPDSCTSCAVLSDAERHGRTSRAYRAYELNAEMQTVIEEGEEQHASAADQARQLYEATLRRGVRVYDPNADQPLPPAPDVEILADDDVRGSSGSSGAKSDSFWGKYPS